MLPGEYQQLGAGTLVVVIVRTAGGRRVAREYMARIPEGVRATHEFAVLKPIAPATGVGTVWVTYHNVRLPTADEMLEVAV